MAALPRTVLFVSHDGQVAGAQLALVDTTRALTSAGVDVRVILPARERYEQSLLPHLRAAGATLHPGPIAYWATRPGRRDRFLRLRAMLASGPATRFAADVARDIRADLVVTNTGLPFSLATGARRAGVPHAWWVQERLDRPDIPMAYPVGYRTAFIREHGHVFVSSEFMRAEVSAWCPPEKLHRLAAVVDTPPPLSADQIAAAGAARPTTLLFPGGLHSVKRPFDVLEALALLHDEWPELTLHMPGHGGHEGSEARREIEARAAMLGLANAVTVRGFTQEGPWADVRTGTIVVSAGTDETFGRILVEALARGLPTVAADASASPEVIRHEETGLLFRGGDPASLAAALRRLRDDTALRARLVAQGHAAAHSEWNADAHVASIAAAFSAIRPAGSA